MSKQEDAVEELRRMFMAAKLRVSLWDIQDCPPPPHLTPLTVGNLKSGYLHDKWKANGDFQ